MRIIFLLPFIILLTACGIPATHQVASKHGFEAQYLQTKIFKLASYQNIKQPGLPVNIYIEGDGKAWHSRRHLSADPSPISSTVISLATLDPNPNVVYLARPCQFSPDDLNSVCENKYWSLARYSSEIVEAIDSAITQIKQRTKSEQINLIGFSGGGALAILVAANRSDIKSIRTVAGNLDLHAMDKYHKTTPLSESLDPIAVAKKVRHIPQLHFSGKQDKVVPTSIAYNFIQAADLESTKVIVVDADHKAGWKKQWPQLLKYIP
jgi:hypothetical protein